MHLGINHATRFIESRFIIRKMATIAKINPYRPGFGLEPDYLAGRNEECQIITAALEMINESRGSDGALLKSPFSPTVLIGPRGVGKTVLLYYAQVQAQKLGIAFVEIAKRHLEGDLSKLMELIAPGSFMQRIARKITGLKFGYKNVGAELGLDFAQVRNNINLALQTRLSKEPLLLIMDEVHTYESEYLGSILVVIQEMLKNKMPLAVIMAGTPGLSKLLHSCGASFVERSERIRMNVLDQEATKLALAEPAKQSGLPLMTDALEALVASSDCYPYFIQLLGRDAWQVARNAGHEEITLADAQHGIDKAQKQRDEFYGDRLSELRDHGLHNHAYHVIEWMQAEGNSILTDKVYDNFINLDKLDSSDTNEIINNLISLGFVWEIKNILYPGIPSLFDYIEDTRLK